MGIFNTSSPFDGDIEKATSENNTSEQWGAIMDVCDKVGTSSTNAKDCLRSVVKRLANPDPHVVVQAITLLDACVNNCGKNFHLEIASRDFENEYRRLLARSQPAISQKLRILLKKWTEGEFKSDPQLNLIPSLYNKLKSEGMDFSDTPESTPKPVVLSKDPNVVSSQQEQDDIAKAIELSLKEKSNSPRLKSTGNSTSVSNLYPSVSLVSSNPASEARKVRALYDFEAAEDNELTFLAGEIIHVQDDTDPNWWKGFNQRGEGLFPANFVTADLSVEPEQLKVETSRKTVQFSDAVEVKTIAEEAPGVIEINESSIDRLLHLLNEANPEDSSSDTDEMFGLEAQVNHMGPMIDAELERIDRKHAHLTQLSSDLVEALNLYHTLMREPERPIFGYQHQSQMYQPRGYPVMPQNSMGIPGPPPVYGMSGPMMLGAMGAPAMGGPMPTSMTAVNIPQGSIQSQMGPTMTHMGTNPSQIGSLNLGALNSSTMVSTPNIPPPSSQMSQQHQSSLGPSSQMLPNIQHSMIPPQLIQSSHLNGPRIIPSEFGSMGVPQLGPMTNDDSRQNITYQPRNT